MAVKVIVKNKRTKRPIPFVMVQIIGKEDYYEDDTDINGVADFSGDDIKTGKYKIKVRSFDFRPYTETHYIINNSYTIHLNLHPAID